MICSRQVFESIDKDENGTLSYEEFATAISKLPLEPPFTTDELSAVIDALDTNWYELESRGFPMALLWLRTSVFPFLV